MADGEEFVDAVLQSILQQTRTTNLECVIYLDYCLDKTEEKILRYSDKCRNAQIGLKLIKNNSNRRGVGFGRNRAIEASSGEYLCFQDIDDTMYPKRIELQLEANKLNHNAVSISVTI